MVSRPLLRWFGGKWRLAPWIIAHLPPHRVYVEPFGGAGSVLIRKKRTHAEVWNDLDGEVVNLFRVLRDDASAARLCKMLHLTPFARQEFIDAYAETGDPVERARRLVIIAFMGFGSNAHNKHPTGFRSNSSRSGTTPAADWHNYPPALAAIVERLRGVVIESKDALAVMADHDAPATLHYVDPPYVWDTRSPGNTYDRAYRGYVHDMDDAAHERMADALHGLKGMVVLSGYPSALYDRLFAGWPTVTVAAHADGALDRTECLWFNATAWQNLDGKNYKQLSLTMEVV